MVVCAQWWQWKRKMLTELNYVKYNKYIVLDDLGGPEKRLLTIWITA